MDFGCAAYCSYAEQCLGDMPPELVAQKEDLFKDRVAVAVKRHLKNDFRRIGHITRRARHAEALAKAARINPAVVLMAAYLWDLDAGKAGGVADLQETPMAEAMLEQLKAPAPLVEKVCALIRDGQAPIPDAGNAELNVIIKAEQLALAEEKGN
jgi:hypothetical protein